MVQITITEKAGIHLMHGAGNRYGKGKLRLYREKFLNRKRPDQKLFSYLHHQLRVKVSFYLKRPHVGHSRHVRVPEMEKRMLS